MSDRRYSLKHVPGSEALAFLAGMSQIDQDVAYPTILFQRSTIINNTVLRDTQDRKVLDGWEFWCDGIIARIEPLAADTRSPSQFFYVNVKESGSGKLMFPDDVPASLLSGAAGGAVGAALVPAEQYSGFTSRTFKLPYVYQSGSTITFQFSSDGNLAAGARICEIALTGYMVRKGILVMEEGR